jgi:rhodanese-related sulfurtransferase
VRNLKWCYSLKIFSKILTGVVVLSLTNAAFAGEIKSDVSPEKVNQSRSTSLGLYLSPKGAFKALKENPKIVFIDVRDPIEVSFVGHAVGTDKNIPLSLATHEFSPELGRYKMKENPNLLVEVKNLIDREGVTKKDPIFVACRSGGRSGKVARKLIKAGYTNVWNLVEGFEGDKNNEGVRTLNGWRNTGLPWTYKIPETMAWNKENMAPKK